MHWKGSNRAPISGALVKWPEIDTRYFGGMLKIRWLFYASNPEDYPFCRFARATDVTK